MVKRKRREPGVYYCRFEPIPHGLLELSFNYLIMGK